MGVVFFRGRPSVLLPPPNSLSVLIGKNANTTAATWNKIAVVDTWLNKTYLPKANQTGPLAGASSIAAQKANNAYKVRERERERKEGVGWRGRETSAPGGPCAGTPREACPIKTPPFPHPLSCYQTTAYVYNATAHKVVLAIAAKANLTR